MRSLTSSLSEAFLYVGVPSLMSVRLLFCVTVVSLVPEVPEVPENGTITYHTNDCKEPITLHCFKEKQSSLTASVEVLHVITILQNEVQMARGRVPKFEELQKQKSDADSYCVTHTVHQSNAFQVTEFITSQLSKRICGPVQNRMGEELKLRKGQIIAEIKLVGENREQGVKVA